MQNHETENRKAKLENRHQFRLRTPLLNHSPLNRDNVVITPHIAFNSQEAVKRILSTTVENLRAFLRGQPQNLLA